MQEIAPLEFQTRWAQDDRLVLLDVREDWELARASVDGATHIAMADIPQSLEKLDPKATIIVMCHSGARSARVAQFLEQNGFAPVFNLSGGIDRWACEVDTSVPRY